MANNKWEELMARTRNIVEKRLTSWFDSVPQCEVNQAGRYAVLGGGHRWRAMFATAISELFDPAPDIFDTVLSGAAAIELIHAASLVLDDLPSMDNAEMRRGKACSHLVYPGWVVDLLPVYLVTGAYDLFLSGGGTFPERLLKAVQVLSRTGIEMIKGQENDLVMVHEEDSEDSLMRCYRLKTGALWSTAGQAAAIICGADQTSVQKVMDCGMNIALYYQFIDDVGDATGTVATIGKTAGQDTYKLTSVSLYGLKGARQRAKAFQDKALESIDTFGTEADFLRHLITRASYVLE
jgi:geranylgeranyl pyrophosphate synthase